jgi:hypothetical protein
MAETQPPQLNDGLRVETDGLGSGEPAKNGMTLHIEYKGAITNGYIVFDEGTRYLTKQSYRMPISFLYLAGTLASKWQASGRRFFLSTAHARHIHL